MARRVKQVIATRRPAAADPRRVIAELEKKLGEQAAERDEALAQQAATAEILQIINRSSGDAAPVFEAILERAMRLCDAAFGGLLVPDGEYIRYVAFRAVPKAFTDFLAANRVRLRTLLGPAYAARAILHVADLSKSEAYRRRIPVTVSAVEDGGIRTMFLVPLLKDGALIGALTIYRQEVRPFTDRQIAIAQSFADQAVIAIENVRLFTELRESLDRQTATSDVLGVISSSPGQLQPVFEKLLECALRLCHAHMGTMARAADGAFTHAASSSGAAANAAIATLNNYRPPPNSPLGQMLATKATVQVLDYAETLAYAERAPGVVALVELGGARSALQVPLLKDGEVVGNITIYRPEVRAFDDKEVALVENFAKQAVIAIENARLLDEINSRNRDLTQSLDRQTATSDILGAIAASPGEAAGTLKKIAETTARLFGAAGVSFRVAEGDTFKWAVGVGRAAEQLASQLYDDPARRPTVGGRNLPGAVVRENRQILLRDLDNLGPEFADWPGPPVLRAAGIRTAVGTPLRAKDRAIGALIVYHNELRLLDDAELRLLQSFADQAVIAIENARLINETREALEKQTATAEILRVISGSPTDLRPTIDAIAARATRLTGAATGHVFTYDGTLIHHRSHDVATKDALDAIRAVFPTAPSRGSAVGRAILTREVAHVVDPKLDPEFAHVGLAEYGTVLSIPMLRDGNALGAITVVRHRVEGFTEAQIDLLKTFADQAVIAIENVRLFTELRERTDDLQESLEYQTATSDVLKVISRSTYDLTPVLQYVLDTAMRLCRAPGGSIFRLDGAIYRYAVGKNLDPVYEEIEKNTPIAPDEGTVVGRAALQCRTVQILDAWNDPLYAQKESARITNARTMLGVPLLREGVPIGVIAMARQEVAAFDDKEIALVTTFADQAVIAIENARLLSELRESLDRQTAMSEVLSVISASPGQVQPVYDKLLECALRLCQGHLGAIALATDGAFTQVAATANQARDAALVLNDYRPPPNSPLGRMLATKATIQIRDYAATEAYTAGAPAVMHLVDVGGARSAVQVPLLKDGEVVGVINVYRDEVRPFGEKETTLLENFAAQAVIAIENARLLTELRELLDRQTAMSEVLSVISASPGQVQPVFEKMLECALRLCRSHMGLIHQVTDGAITTVAKAGAPPDFLFRLDDYRPAPDSPMAEMLTTKSTIRVDDYAATESYANGNPAVVALVKQGRGRSAMQVPMLKDDTVVGAMTIYRPEVRPFNDQDMAIAEDFAKQAVIAIENARLLTELRESLEQQQAMAEVLQVINASPGNLQPVFDAILEKAHSLCGATYGNMQLWNGEELHLVAARGRSTFAVGQRRRPNGPNDLAQRLISGETFVHFADVREVDDPTARRAAANGSRSVVMVPLRKESTLLGLVVAVREEVRPFTEKQIALLQSFAAQAVIAMDNARLLNEIRQRQAELRVTFDNMGDAVIMFDGEQRLVAWNRNFLHMLDIPEEWLATPRTYADFAAYLTERGEFGDTPPPDLGAPETGEVRPIRYERVRPDGRVLEVRRNPVPGGAGFVFIYSDITERKLAERSILAAREAAEHALADLKLAQANLVQSEKMASLGQLTAGIAHEIKNPLNFVNNFANLSNELLGELKETAAPAFATLDADKRDEIDETMAMLTGNLEKIQEHGRRADGIVKSMLAHSRGGSGDRREADINALVEESLNLAYHGARAQDQNFNITLERDYDKSVAPLELVPQDITRVFLNLCGNGFYAANKRRRDGGEAAFRPVLKVATRELGDAVEVRIRDNGTGIPPEVKEKLFQPFFTTKPTGEGTGLGLSISYDIVTQQHRGTIDVDSQVGDFTEFTIRLPRKR